ncbi:MAG: hypothetical protein ACK4HR_07585 [Hyphomonas sp.]
MRRRTAADIRKQQDRLSKTRKALSDASTARSEGARKVADGQRMKAEAEAQFQAACPEESLN